MVAMKGKLLTPVEWRYEVRNGCEVTRAPRKHVSGLYGCPIQNGSPDAYVWEESSDRYVIAVKAETRARGTNSKRGIGCYHVLPTCDAAVMFALAASN